MLLALWRCDDSLKLFSCLSRKTKKRIASSARIKQLQCHKTCNCTKTATNGMEHDGYDDWRVTMKPNAAVLQLECGGGLPLEKQFNKRNDNKRTYTANLKRTSISSQPAQRVTVTINKGESSIHNHRKVKVPAAARRPSTRACRPSTPNCRWMARHRPPPAPSADAAAAAASPASWARGCCSWPSESWCRARW